MRTDEGDNLDAESVSKEKAKTRRKQRGEEIRAEDPAVLLTDVARVLRGWICYCLAFLLSSRQAVCQL